MLPPPKRGHKHVSCHRESRVQVTAFDMRFVTQSKFRTHFGSTLFAAKEDDIDGEMQQRPALERVPLNGPDVAQEGLRGGKKCQHFASEDSGWLGLQQGGHRAVRIYIVVLIR